MSDKRDAGRLATAAAGATQAAAISLHIVADTWLMMSMTRFLLAGCDSVCSTLDSMLSEGPAAAM
jgi:hypothetical protein